MTNKGGKPSGFPPSQHMPPLDRATREALTESIREYGVINPVVKDQTGYVLDGHHRIAIATELGVPVPEVVYECDPDRRAIIGIELNGVRRPQLSEAKWKPLVDHLRRQGFADRLIARAIGISRDKVQRYSSPKSAHGASAPTARSVTTEDGKSRHIDREWTVPARILHLIGESTAGLTAPELERDEVLSGFSHSIVSRTPAKLRDEGKLEAAGKRDGAQVWVLATASTLAPEPTRSKKAERIVKDLQDPAVVQEVKEWAEQSKEARRAVAAVRAAEKELNAAIAAEEQRQVESQKERMRLAELARDQAVKSVKYWEDLTGWITSATEVLAIYFRDFDDLPPIMPGQVRLLDQALEDLRGQLHRFEVKLHPDGGPTPIAQRADIIDI